MSDARRSWARIAVIGVSVLAVTLLLELTGTTDVGYGFPMLFTIVFTMVWGWFDSRRRM